MQRVIGLDIGSYSIKAVEIVNTFNSYEIANFYENVIPHLEDVPMESVAPSCMEQLFKENNLEADRIVTAMPGQFISSRVLTFNFADPRKVEAAVYAEIEDAVPFNMDDMILDHQILGSVSGKTVALAVMTRKAFLKNFLDLLQRINIDPKLVDIDSLAFYNLSSFMDVEPGENFAMVDIGHEKTSMCIVRDGVLRMFRSINLGGRYITEFLARDLECTFQEAQRQKHQVSRVFCAADDPSHFSGDERLVVERTTLAVNAIIKELGRTIYSYKSYESEPISRLFLSGGTSVMQGLPELIEEQLEVKALHCRLNQTELKINSSLGSYMDVMPQSVAIGMRTVASVKKHSQINLRQGEFAYVQDYEAFLKVGMTIAQYAAVGLLLLVFSYSMKSCIYNGHIDELQEQYRKQYVSIFPEDKKKYRAGKKIAFRKLKRDTRKKMEGRIDEMRRAVATFQAENSGAGALTLLRDISSGMPKNLQLDVTDYDFKTTENGNAKINMRIETDGYKSQALVIEALKQIPALSDFSEKSDAKPGTQGKVIESRISATYLAPQNRGEG